MTQIRFFLIILLLIATAGCKKDPVESFTNSYNSYKNGTIDKNSFHAELISFVKNESFPKANQIFEDTAVYTKKNNSLGILLPWKFTVSLNDEIEEITISSSETLQSMVISHKKGIIVFNNRGVETGRFQTEDGSKISVNGGTPFGEGALFYMDNQLHQFDPSTGSVKTFRDSRFTPHYQEYFKVQLIDTDKTLYLVYGSVGMYKISAINLTSDAAVIAGLNAASSRVFADSSNIYFIAGAIGNWELTRQPASSSPSVKIKSFNDLRDIILFEEGYAYQQSEGVFISKYEGSPIKIPFQWRLKGKYRNQLVFITGNEYILADFSRIFEAFDLAEGVLEE